MAVDTATVLEALPNLDLEEIRKEIAQKEAELEDIVSEKRKTIDALRQLERLVDTAQNGPKKRSPRSSRATAPRQATVGANGEQLTVRQRALVYLGHNGATKFLTLAEAIQCNSGQLYQLANDDPYFEKDGPLLRLTPQGQRAASA